MKEPRDARWSRGDHFALWGVLIALAGALAAWLVVPEVRNFFALDPTELRPRPSPTVTPTGASPQPTSTEGVKSTPPSGGDLCSRARVTYTGDQTCCVFKEKWGNFWICPTKISTADTGTTLEVEVKSLDRRQMRTMRLPRIWRLVDHRRQSHLLASCSKLDKVDVNPGEARKLTAWTNEPIEITDEDQRYGPLSRERYQRFSVLLGDSNVKPFEVCEFKATKETKETKH